MDAVSTPSAKSFTLFAHAISAKSLFSVTANLRQAILFNCEFSTSGKLTTLKKYKKNGDFLGKRRFFLDFIKEKRYNENALYYIKDVDHRGERAKDAEEKRNLPRED